MKIFWVHIHKSTAGHLPSELWNACVAPDRHTAIVAVLRAYDAHIAQPPTVYTLDSGTPGKTILCTTAHDLQWEN